MSETPQTPEKTPQSTLQSAAAESINAHYLRHLRENIAEMTPEELATEMEVEVEMVQQWETGRRQPSQKHQAALEKFFSIPSGSLTFAMKDVIINDFNAAYFEDETARQRIEWIDKHLRLAQVLTIIPRNGNSRLKDTLAELLAGIL